MLCCSVSEGGEGRPQAMQVVMLGTGDAWMEAALCGLAPSFPGWAVGIPKFKVRTYLHMVPPAVSYAVYRACDLVPWTQVSRNATYTLKWCMIVPCVANADMYVHRARRSLLLISSWQVNSTSCAPYNLQSARILGLRESGR